ncbi:MAG: Dabb family protein [Spirochaetota bacterium]
MIKHIVMWTFQASESASKEENIAKAKELLLAMPEQIAQIASLEVGDNFSTRPVAYDLVLITTHNHKQDLQGYIAHPKHQEVAAFIGSVKDKSAVVDFEC